jgi:opacity protein-like surface antigen
MRKTARILNLLAILSLAAVPSFAQTTYRFEVFGAGTFPQDKDFQIALPQSTVPIDGTHEFSPGGRGGIRFGADGSGHLGQDFIYSYGTNASRIVNHTYGTDFAFTNRIHHFSYNALYYPYGLSGNKKVFPFLTGGVGGIHAGIGQRTVNEGGFEGLGKMKGTTEFAFNVGGGVRFRINGIYGFRLDVRDIISLPLRYGFPKESEDPAATVFPVTGMFHQLEISFAFVYHLK